MGQFEIVLKFAAELGAITGKQMMRLAEEGVLLLKGVTEGEGVVKYYLAFRNVILESGNLKEIKDAIGKIVREGKAELGLYLERLFVTSAGTGGGYKYLTEVSSARMVAQEQPMSCAAACIRQLLQDNGKLVTEDVIRNAALTSGLEKGTDLGNIGPALRSFLPDRNVLAGSVDLLPGVKNYSEMARVLSKESSHSWIAILKPSGRPCHTVLVDNISKDIVYIRDPWGVFPGYGVANGMEATMRLEDFVELWKGSRFHIVIIVK